MMNLATVSEDKLERLRKAVNILSEAEKQLRVSKDKMTWLIAAVLQLGPDPVFPVSGSGTSITQSPNTLVDVEHGLTDIEHISVAQRLYRGDVESSSVSISSHTSTKRTTLAGEQVKVVSYREHAKSDPASFNPPLDKTTKEFLLTPGDINDIWFRVVQICRPFRLRQSLHRHGKLVSISLLEGKGMFPYTSCNFHCFKYERLWHLLIMIC